MSARKQSSPEASSAGVFPYGLQVSRNTPRERFPTSASDAHIPPSPCPYGNKQQPRNRASRPAEVPSSPVRCCVCGQGDDSKCQPPTHSHARTRTRAHTHALYSSFLTRALPL